ncbi:hypothetical protein [Prescottella agglutinans]|jgi:hypothetical protein
MSSDYWAWLVNHSLSFFGITLIGLMTASQQGGGWASLDSMTSGS